MQTLNRITKTLAGVNNPRVLGEMSFWGIVYATLEACDNPSVLLRADQSQQRHRLSYIKFIRLDMGHFGIMHIHGNSCDES